MKISKFLLLVIPLIAAISCSDDNTNPLKNDEDANYYITGTSKTYNASDIFPDISNHDIIGLVELEAVKKDVDYMLDEAGSPKLVSYNGTYHDAEAGFYNGSFSRPIKLVESTVNNIVLQNYAEGAYKVTKVRDLVNQFGTSLPNTVHITESEGLFDELDAEIIFDKPVEISNIDKLQDFDKNQDFELKWNGGNKDAKVEIAIEYYDPFDKQLKGDENIAISFLADNTGSHIIKKAIWQQLTLDGKYNISVRSFEEVYKNVSSGKEIAFIGNSAHEISINLK